MNTNYLQNTLLHMYKTIVELENQKYQLLVEASQLKDSLKEATKELQALKNTIQEINNQIIVERHLNKE